jgi:SET and MYND domain-containing protein 4
MKNNQEADRLRNAGNAFFRESKFYEALVSYNQSLCHAVPKSEQLSLAYANRAAVYLEIEQFSKCLDNIQLARDHGYKSEMKLKEREDKCKKKNQQQDPTTFFKLSYPSHKKNRSIVDCLDIKENEQFGQHIVTTRNLNPGDVIAIEEPIFPLVLNGGRYALCNNCLKSNLLSLIPCDRKCTFGEFFQTLLCHETNFS